MRKSYEFLLITVFSIALVSTHFAQASVPDLVSKFQPSVVKIKIYDKDDGILGTGSGFFVSKESIITNKHVMDGAVRATIQLSDGSIRNVLRIVSSDNVGDLALLRVLQQDKVIPLPIAKFAPRVGEQIIVIGSPLGLEGSVTTGIVSAFRQSASYGKLVQISAPISPGSSGSPVMNSSGLVIGVATSYLESGQNLNFAISADRIITLWPNNIEIIAETTKLPEISTTELNACGDSPYPYDTSLSDPWEYIYKGQDLLSAGRLLEAKEAFKRAARVNPKMPEAYFSLWRVYSKLSYQHKTSDCYDKTIVAIRQALILRPKDKEFRSGLALELMLGNQFDEASRVLQEGIRLLPKEPENFSLLGDCLFYAGKQTEAFNYYDKARKLDSKHTKAYVGLARVLIFQKNKEGANKYLAILQNMDAAKALEIEKEMKSAFPQ